MSEVDRIRRIYHRYDTAPAERAKRDPRNPGNVAMEREFRAAAQSCLDQAGVPLGTAHILDVGCGSGGILGWLTTLGASPERCWGIDLLENRVAAARTRYAAMRFAVADARHLEFPSDHFDLVVCSTLFSSILDQAIAEAVAAEIGRVLKPGGMVLWYDSRYPNPWNRYVRGYRRREIQALFPGYSCDLSAVTVAPPLARRLGRLTPALYPLLARVPLLRIRYLGIIRAPGGQPW